MSGRMLNLIGKTIVTLDGKKYTLGKMMGHGAQGVVYEDSTGSRMIKFYYPAESSLLDEDRLDRLRFIQNIQLPDNFVKIHALIDQPYVGFVMEKVSGHKPLNAYLIPSRKMSFAEWYNQGLGLRERIFVGYIIAKAFGDLEKRNLSYCDISGNNILVKIGKNASVRMIDIDNIYIAGKGPAVVLGTPRYIAPEVIDRQRNPDVLSDNYSLAVILFELLRAGHPYISDDILDGTPEDEEAALAGKYDYVTDDNATNMLPEDVVFTDKLKKLFRKCFVDGKKDRLARPSAREFEYALLEASNKVTKCPNCERWHYARKTGKVYDNCPWCDAPSKPRAWLNFYDRLSEGNDYRVNAPIEGNSNGKLVNSYILREGYNTIKSLYILRYDDLSKSSRASENYALIIKDKQGRYWIQNKYSKSGIVVHKANTGTYIHSNGTEHIEKRCKQGEYIRLEDKIAITLNNGDRIFFEMNTSIEVAGKQYSFIRMVGFKEEKQ